MNMNATTIAKIILLKNKLERMDLREESGILEASRAILKTFGIKLPKVKTFEELKLQLKPYLEEFLKNTTENEQRESLELMQEVLESSDITPDQLSDFSTLLPRLFDGVDPEIFELLWDELQRIRGCHD